MSTDLIITGKYGVLNSQKLLNATSNNINNVNTEGYVRKETQTYTSCVDWGVGATYTRRVYDKYVQRQLFVDNGIASYYNAFGLGMKTTDSVLSDADMSIAKAASSFFDELSTAANTPTSSASRNNAKSKLENLVLRINSATESMVDSLKDTNSKITDDIDDINSYSYAICKINAQIRSLSLSDNSVNNEIYMQMLDERDRLIGELSNLASVNVKEQQDGCLAVYMDQGMLLANGDTYATLSSEANQFDNTKTDVYMHYNGLNGPSNQNTGKVKLSNNQIGGSLGGYLNSTDQIRNSMRELGKLTVALADALNVQNKAGFTLEDIAGDNLLNIPSVWGTSNQSGINDNSILATFNEGQGSNVQGYDFQVSFVDGELNVYRVDEGKGKVNITADLPAGAVSEAGGKTYINLSEYGITLTMNKDLTTLKNDGTIFLVQPTMMVGSLVSSNVSKPEDFAFASAVRTRTASDNYGNATISLSRCTNTGAAYGVSVDPTTKHPVFNAGAPTQIQIDNAGNYLIKDSAGNLLGRAPASCNGVNVLANAVTYDAAAGAFTTTPMRDYGYDVSVSGTVKDNDKFYIEINTGGQADNSNGNALIALRNKTIVRTTGSEQVTTFNDGYANLLAKVGSDVSAASANYEAAVAKQEQTQKLYDSSAGVNLDEEAANLLMFQQSYSACSKIIEASQTVFNALLNAM
ncbi:MAG: flagellar basal body rod C-terminal domain-containing protein [Succinivibrio sp.]|uniref:Flagellar hook-associated protein 1 n=1 Tax=Succinivibrio faecicola TaxID=2820300 RepID=A0ABS7DER1_9GAMM|nr:MULTISPECIES: flagellar basal body rod C-terminal domain-containing protein [Succinivibrio]MBW7569597.1 hypothetical protein [Succinivibrio faecicola]MCI6938950.1 hypothetical protein [Succinatimonas hippei]MDD6206275.1 flagellar basal body rod C-terminal domain-containing protein [Succinivibrio sp.]